MICGENMKLYDLPQNWKWISVRDMGSQDRPVLKAGPFGSSLKKSDYTLSGFRVYGQEQVIAGNLEIGNYYISEKKFKSLESCSVRSGDILMSLVGSFGKTLIVPDEFEPGIINPRLLRIALDSEKFSPDFFCYFVQSRFAQTQINLMSHGGTMGILNAKNVGELLLPVPSIAEQKRIAAILDKADAVRRKRREAIRLTEELLRSTFLEMFGDPITNPQGWDIKSIGQFSEVSTGRTPSRQEPENYGGLVSWVKTTEVKDCWIYTTEETLSSKGARGMNIFPIKSILIAMYGQGSTRGKSAILGIPASTNQACAVISPNNQFDSIYLWSFLRFSYEKLRELGRGGNQPNLNLSMVRDFPVIFPPIENQKRFSEAYRFLDIQLRHYKVALKESENLFNSLLQRAFTGNL
jgi:type I restriction enzyme S subunit